MTTHWEAYKQQRLTSPSCGGQNSEIRVSAGLSLRTGGSEGGGVLGSSSSWRLPAVLAILGLWLPRSRLCLWLHMPLPVSVSLSVSYKDIRVEVGPFVIQNGLSWISTLIPSTRTLIQGRTLRFHGEVNVGGRDSAPVKCARPLCPWGDEGHGERCSERWSNGRAAVHGQSRV